MEIGDFPFFPHVPGEFARLRTGEAEVEEPAGGWVPEEGDNALVGGNFQGAVVKPDHHERIRTNRGNRLGQNLDTTGPGHGHRADGADGD